MIKSSRLIFCFLLVCFLVISSKYTVGQRIPIENITKKYGINRTTTYRVFTDKKGYLWVTANPGIFRFDGYEFKEMFKGTNLQRTSIYKASQDEKGNIWFLSSKKVVYKYDGKELSEFDLSKIASCGDGLNKLTHTVTFYVDSLEQFHIGSGSGYGHLITNCKTEIDLQKENKSHLLLDKTREHDFFFYSLKRDEKKKLVAFTGKNLPIHIKRNSNDTVIDLPMDDAKNPFKRFRYFSLKEGRSIVSLRKRMYFIKNNNELLVKDFDQEVICAYEDHKGRIWVTEGGAEIHVFDQNLNKLNITLYELYYLSANTIFQDNQNGYWFSTLGRGLFYARGTTFKSYNFKKRTKVASISGMVGDGKDGVYAYNGAGIVYQIDSNFDIVKLWDITEVIPHARLRKIKFIRKFNCLVVGTNYGAAIIDLETDKIIKPKTASKIDAFTAEELTDSTIIVLGRGDAVVLNKDWQNNKKHYKVSLKHQVSKSERDSTGKLWMITKKGLRVLEDEKLIKPFPKDSLLDDRIYDITLVKDKVFAGCLSNGLVTNWGDSIHQIGSEYGVPDFGITSVQQQDDSTIWVGARDGLFKLSINKNGYEAVRIGKTEGAPDGEAFKISKSRDKIWLSIGGEVLSFYSADITKEKVTSPLYIIKIEEDGKEYGVTGENEFEYGEKVLSFHFRNLNFSKQGDIRYQYRLLGASDKWIDAKEPVARYTALSPGEYIFEVRAENNNGDWTDSKSISFSVLPAFWQTIWFKLIIVVILIALVFLFVRYRYILLKRKEAVKIELAHLELKALKAQINPHFIFNSIASVQFYLSKNKPEEAQQYMQDFAQLIRKVLEHSDSNLVSLNSELKVIDNYIKLESKKFKGDGVVYVENLDKSVDPDKILIPPALIQPYVENAIWHGLKYKEEQREISLSIRKNKEKLVVAIKDNGIGREASKQKNKNKKTKSFGMSITAERIKVLNGAQGENYVRVKDMKDNLGNALGTEVLLLVPYIKSTERIAI